MNVRDIIDRLTGLGIELAVEDDELRVRGRKSSLTPELVATLRSNKAALMERLRAQACTHDDARAVGFFDEGADRLVQLSGAEADKVVGTVAGGAANVQDVYPLTPIQEGMLFHHMMSEAADPYVLSEAFAFDSRERLDAYLAAYQAVIDRHDILRTAIVWDGLDMPMQVVWRRAALPVQEMRLDAAQGDALQAFKALLDSAASRIEIARAPLLRADVAYDTASDRWMALVSMHHLVADHMTLETIQQEIGAHLCGRQATLSPSVSFRRFVAALQARSSQDAHDAFFTRMLANVTQPTAPFGLVETQGDGSAIGQHQEMLPSDLSRRLRDAARQAGVAPAAICHAAWALVLARVTGLATVVFGTVVFGRMRSGDGADRALGPFVNTLPLRVDVAGRTVAALVDDVQRVLAQLLQHEHASLAGAQRCSGVRSPAPLFTSILNYRYGSAAGASAIDGWTGITALQGKERSNYPLSLDVDDLGDDFVCVVQAGNPIEPARVHAWMTQALTGLVHALERDPARPSEAIDVLPEAECQWAMQSGGPSSTGRGALPEPDATASAMRAHAPPRGAFEEAVASAWCAVLGLERVSRDDDFFELGGHSLLAVQVLSRVRRALSVDLALTSLFAWPVLHEFAQAARQAGPLGKRVAATARERQPSDGSRATLIREGRGKPPLFLVHDGVASLGYASTLAAGLDAEVPVYGLPAEPLSAHSPETIEGMAARMVPMMRHVQPKGPYRIAGRGAGGAIAYEIAVQLCGQDLEVAYIGLMHALYDDAMSGRSSAAPATVLSEILHRDAAITGGLDDVQADTLARHLDGEFPLFVEVAASMGLLPASLSTLPPDDIARTIGRQRTIASAAARYVPTPVPVQVHYYGAIGQDRANGLGGWNGALPDVDWVPVDAPASNLEPLGRMIGAALSSTGKAPPARQGWSHRALTLLHVSPRDGAPPLLCVPGAGASMLGFRELAAELGRGRAVHGFQPHGLDGRGLPHASVEAAAASYLRELRAEFGTRPVHLLGHSFGGWVAFEMASRLAREGLEVRSLTVVDSENPHGPDMLRETTDLQSLMHLIAIFEDMSGRSLELPEAQLATLSERERRERLHARLVAIGRVPRRSSPDFLVGPIRAFARCLRTTYRPAAVYAGPMNLVLVDDPALDSAANAARQHEILEGWRVHASTLTYLHGPGSHMTVLNAPHVDVLASLIERHALS